MLQVRPPLSENVRKMSVFEIGLNVPTGFSKLRYPDERGVDPALWGLLGPSVLSMAMTKPEPIPVGVEARCRR